MTLLEVLQSSENLTGHYFISKDIPLHNHDYFFSCGGELFIATINPKTGKRSSKSKALKLSSEYLTAIYREIDIKKMYLLEVPEKQAKYIHIQLWHSVEKPIDYPKEWKGDIRYSEQVFLDIVRYFKDRGFWVCFSYDDQEGYNYSRFLIQVSNKGFKAKD